MLDFLHARLSRRMGLMLLAAIGFTMTLADVVSAEDKVDLLFVQSAPEVAVVGDELRLKNVSPSTLFFSDRPERMTGQLNPAEWQKLWSDGRGSMQKTPPNAVLSVFEPGKTDPTETVLELRELKADGPDLVYTIHVLNGSPSAAGGQSALFIDDVPVSSFAQLEARDCHRHGCADF